jgi:hypothetical protein
MEFRVSIHFVQQLVYRHLSRVQDCSFSMHMIILEIRKRRWRKNENLLLLSVTHACEGVWRYYDRLHFMWSRQQRKRQSMPLSLAESVLELRWQKERLLSLPSSYKRIHHNWHWERRYVSLWESLSLDFTRGTTRVRNILATPRDVLVTRRRHHRTNSVLSFRQQFLLCRLN